MKILKGEVSDEEPEYIKLLQNYKRQVRAIPSKLKNIDDMRKQMIEIRNQWRVETNETRKNAMTKNIIGFAKDIEGIYKGLKDHIQKIPLIVYKGKRQKETFGKNE